MGIYLKKIKNANLKKHMHLNVHSSIIYNCKDKEVTKVSINRWMYKDDVISTHTNKCTHMCICAYMHRNSNKPEKRISWLEGKLAISSNMDGLGGYYARKINTIDITYMWNL